MYMTEKGLIFAQTHSNNLPDEGSVRKKTFGSLQQLIFHRYWWLLLWKVITRPIKTTAGLQGFGCTIRVRENPGGHSQAVNWHLCRCARVGVRGMHTSSCLWLAVRSQVLPTKKPHTNKKRQLVSSKCVFKKTPPPITVIITLRDILP